VWPPGRPPISRVAVHGPQHHVRHLCAARWVDPDEIQAGRGPQELAKMLTSWRERRQQGDEAATRLVDEAQLS